MGRASRRPGLARAPAVALLAAFATALAPAVAQARWTRPFRIAGPMTADLLPAQPVLSASAQLGVGFAAQDEDNAASGQAFATLRPSAGRSGGVFKVPGAREVLALGFDGATLELLTATSPRGQACCRSAQIVSFDGRGFGRRRTLLKTLTGDATGDLVALPGQRLLAVIATDRGVWVAQSSRGERFGRARRVSASTTQPASLATAVLRGGHTAIAWAGQPSGTIFTAGGSATHAPRPSTTLLLAPGHQVDELDVGSSGSAATAAWIESWSDASGTYHSQAAAADVHPGARARSFEIAGQAAAGLSFAADARGDQLLAWKTCDAGGGCTARAVTRRAHKAFGSPIRLGQIDGSQSPVAAISSSGRGVVGWIQNGHVLAASVRAGASRASAPRTVSRAGDAADLAIGFGPRGLAAAVWTQGTISPSVIGATFSGS